MNERLRRHHSNHKDFTGGVGDGEIVYQDCYDTKEEAMCGRLKLKINKAGIDKKLIGWEHAAQN